MLQRGISMKQGDLDAYIAEYEVLIEMAGYDPNSFLTLKIFTDGLPTELYKDTLRLDRLRNYAEWKRLPWHATQSGSTSNTGASRREESNSSTPSNPSTNPLAIQTPWTPRQTRPEFDRYSRSRARGRACQSAQRRRPQSRRTWRVTTPFSPKCKGVHSIMPDLGRVVGSDGLVGLCSGFHQRYE